jgi:hypothetical protein
MPTTEAMEFLEAALAAGPVPAAEVGRMARECGLTPKVVRAAREAMAIKIERHGFGPGAHSLWSLPRRGHIDAQPSEVSENSQPKTKTRDGYEIIEPECAYCGKRAGPPGPQSGPVHMVRNPFAGGKFAGTIIPAAELLHEDCAAYWFDWLRKTGHGKV